MSSLLKSMSAAMLKNTPKTLRGRANMVGELVGYGDKTLSVKMLNGPIAGQTVDIDPGPRSPVENFKKSSKAQTSQYTKPGGVLRFDAVQKDGDAYKSNWTNVMTREPNDAQRVEVDLIASYSATRIKTSTGLPLAFVSIIDPEGETRVSTMAELREAMIAAFQKNGRAMVIDIEDGVMSAGHYRLNEIEKDGKRVRQDPAEAADTFIEDLGDNRAQFETELAARGLTVVPERSVQIGGKTAEETANEIRKAAEAGREPRVMSVDPGSYRPAPLGARIAAALNRDGDDAIPEEQADRLKKAFLAQAPDSAQDAFLDNGWRSVSDGDLKAFFASQGVEIEDRPKAGWNKAAIMFQKYEGGDDVFVVRSHESARYGSPYPLLKCTEELRAAYRDEIPAAIRAAVAPAATADARTETVAPKAESKQKAAPATKAEPAEKAPITEAEDAALSDMDAALADIADDSMSL